MLISFQNLNDDQKARYFEDIVIKTHLHEITKSESLKKIYDNYVFKELNVHKRDSIPTSQVDLIKVSLNIMLNF